MSVAFDWSDKGITLGCGPYIKRVRSSYQGSKRMVELAISVVEIAKSVVNIAFSFVFPFYGRDDPPCSESRGEGSAASVLRLQPPAAGADARYKCVKASLYNRSRP